MTDLQSQVQKAIDDLVESGAERGLQVAVYKDGEQVVDAVGGVADPEIRRPVASDTPFFSFSIGKGVAATVVHVLAGRGVLDYDTPISELWPEFGAHGKERATIRHALSQSAGVPGLPDGLTVEDLCDWEMMCEIISDSEPWWEPGEKIGYHAITWGYIVGEIILQATGKPIPQVLREEVAGPLGVAMAISGENQIFGFPSAWELGYSIGQFMPNAHETQHVFGVGGHRWQPRLCRHRDRYDVRAHKELANRRFQHRRASRRDRHPGRCGKLAGRAARTFE